MKNVQVIDGAVNSTFDIYAIPDDVFVLLFPEDQNVTFLAAVEKTLSRLGITPVQFWDQFYMVKVSKLRSGRKWLTRCDKMCAGENEAKRKATDRHGLNG
jgi:hypothetical protein